MSDVMSLRSKIAPEFWGMIVPVSVVTMVSCVDDPRIVVLQSMLSISCYHSSLIRYHVGLD